MSAAPRLSCVFVGADTLLLECVDLALAQGHAVVAVVSDAPRIVTACAERGLRLIDPTADLPALLAASPFDHLFAITHLARLPEAWLSLPRRGAINFHDGPLPRYAGLNAPVWALLAGETRYGITWHRMVAAIDEGPLLKQVEFELSPTETALSLNTRCLAAALDTFPDLLEELAEGRAVDTPQDLSQRTSFGRFDRPAAACLVDWCWPASRIEAFVRALSFGAYPNPIGLPKSCAAEHPGWPFILTRVEASEGGEGAPGEVLATDPETCIVQAGRGVITILEARALCGRLLSPAELAAECGLRVGSRLVGPDSQLWRALDALSPDLARAEPAWVRAASALRPPEVVLAHPTQGRAGHGRVPVSLPPGLASRLKERAIPATVAALAVVLARTGRAEHLDLDLDLALVVPREAESTPGLGAWLAARLPLRVVLDPEAPFEQIAGQVGRTLARLRQGPARLRDLLLRHPTLADGPGSQDLPVAISIDPEPAGATPPAGALLTLVLSPDGQRASLAFDEQRLSPEAAILFASSLRACLGAALDDLTTPWTRLALLTPAERDRQLGAGSGIVAPWERERCVHQLFEAQARRFPERTAVICGETCLTYVELDRRANQLAHALRQRGIGPDSLVGVHVGRSAELLVATLGVMKAGGAYVPLDPEFPAERLAFMLADSGARVLLTQGPNTVPETCAGLQRLDLRSDRDELDQQPADPPEAVAGPDNLAYLIYTSGSTGRPKGVMVEHQNVLSFFAGMDLVVPLGPTDDPGTWLAVTSLSFDISVLELFWTLARGMTVVVHREPARSARAEVSPAPVPPMGFGLFMWGNDDGPGPQKYRLMLQAARYLDQHGFDAVWTPERHFHAFGGPFPNPSVTGAALAAVTEHLAIRAGSCVAPLHHAIRIAEEWAVVDNLSNGRVGLAFASGWQPNDFVIRPEAFGDHKALMFRQLDAVRRLWRGEAVTFDGPGGKAQSVSTLPRPVQAELPFWVTTAGNPETWRAAGALGANVLTHLLGQTISEVGAKIAAYRQARAEAGHDPAAGVVTLMLHTFVGTDADAVKAQVRGPMKAYLAASMSLTLGFAWSFPAFRRPGGPEARVQDVDLGSLSVEEADAIVDFAFERYFETSGLFGTPEACVAMVERCRGAGVDGIACLMDFGVDTDAVLESLPLLVQVREAANPEALQVAQAPSGLSPEPAAEPTVAEQISRHGVTHLQCTPTMAQMLLEDPDARRALATIEHLMVGGEALPLPLARALAEGREGTLTNLYGPTETTIWSATHRFGPAPTRVPIGRPIANTRAYVLDAHRQLLPPGVPGDLHIAGPGVTRGYHGRPERTDARFLPDPFDAAGGRMYWTGDLACLGRDGELEFLGRVDQQVKLRGYRIELGEIEARLGAHPAVRAAVVDLDRSDPANPRLIAWLAVDGTPPTDAALRALTRETLPEVMVPSRFVHLKRLPQTPNGKVDRQALRALTPETQAPPSDATPPSSALERTIADAWRETLGLERVGVNDNFFDIGGHSLLVVQLHRRLGGTLAQPLSLVDLYRFPTVRALATHLSTAGPGTPAEGLQPSTDRGARRRAALARGRRR